MQLPEETITETIRLPWPTICRLACAAMIRNVSFHDLVETLVKQRVARG